MADISGFVAASSEAIARSEDMKKVVQGSLVDELARLKQLGDFLANGRDWQGRRAEQFQAEWSEMKQSLERARQAVADLAAQAQEITTAIIDAGGGSGR